MFLSEHLFLTMNFRQKSRKFSSPRGIQLENSTLIKLGLLFVITFWNSGARTHGIVAEMVPNLARLKQNKELHRQWKPANLMMIFVWIKITNSCMECRVLWQCHTRYFQKKNGYVQTTYNQSITNLFFHEIKYSAWGGHHQVNLLVDAHNVVLQIGTT